MPMHDWTRVTPNDYRHLHFAWIAALSQALNTGLLPDGYFAMAEHTASPYVPDVLTLTLPTGRRRVSIRHVQDRRLVAVIDIVSPSNKASKTEFADLRDKSAELLRAGVHLLLIDPFPPTARDPQGIHDAVWRALTGGRFEPPADKPLMLAAYAAVGANTFSAFVEPIAVGDALADMPLFLTGEGHIPTSLEETYQSARSGFPAPLRPLLESPAPVG